MSFSRLQCLINHIDLGPPPYLVWGKHMPRVDTLRFDKVGFCVFMLVGDDGEAPDVSFFV